ncbi:MAG: hypothetical protein NVV74_12040 [Magnetospirillum sp.]|nr:hypothetical protein [Magnetospirillum sp.]
MGATAVTNRVTATTRSGPGSGDSSGTVCASKAGSRAPVVRNSERPISHSDNPASTEIAKGISTSVASTLRSASMKASGSIHRASS